MPCGGGTQAGPFSQTNEAWFTKLWFKVVYPAFRMMQRHE
jgi:hypothetical protein